MKKSLVVVALAGAMAFTAASAETVLYGSIRLGAEVAKNHYGENSATANKRGLNMADYGSRVGLKGSEDLGNGMKVLFQLEWGFDGMGNQSATNTSKGAGAYNRLAWVGVTGDWGTVALGRQNNPFTESLNAGTEADEFNADLGTVSALRFATGSVMFSAAGDRAAYADSGRMAAMPTRVGQSIAYVSPSFSGFNFVVAGIADAPDNYPDNSGYNGVYNSSKGFDIYTVGLNYEHESGFYAKAAYLGANLTETHKTANTYGLNVGFKNEQFGVNADFGGGERGRKDQSQSKVSSTGWDVGAHFSFGPDYFSTVRATYGQAKTDYKWIGNAKDQDKMTVWALGFEQKLSTRTKVWVEYAKEDQKSKVNGVKSDARSYKNDAVSIGLRHDF